MKSNESRCQKAISCLAFVLLVVILGVSCARADDLQPFFSEYIEGTSNNKALELYNPSDTAIDLATGLYNIQFYFNGNSIAGTTIALTGIIPARGTYILAHASAHADILAKADQTSTTSFYNGDDAIVLRQGTVVLDCIGQVGFDPGSQWGSGLTSTADNTLVRKPSVSSGDTVTDDVFDPSLQWNGFAVDTFSYLGSHDITSYTVTYSPGTHGTFATQVTTDLIMGSDTPAAPVTSGEPGYSFSNWSPALTATVVGTVEYTAEWTHDEYTVTYDPGRKGTFALQQTSGLYYGDNTPAAPTTIGQEDWVFSGWAPAWTAKVGNTETYIAQWTYVLTQGPIVFYHVYGGGGNTNGVYQNDFIVLKNIGSSSVSVDGWSIKYTSYNGTVWSSFWPLSGSISSDGFYVIKGYYGANSPPQTELPYYNLSAPLLAIDQKEYKIQLLDDSSTVVDFIGSGAADDYLGSGPAPATASIGPNANQQSLIRDVAALNTYSGNNETDYILQSPTDLSYLLHTVTFDENTGDAAAVPSSISVRHGESPENMPAEPVKALYRFNGWNTATDGSGTVLDISTIVTSDLHVYAQWLYVDNEYPQTGDSTQIELWVSLAVLTLLCIIFLIRRLKYKMS